MSWLDQVRAVLEEPVCNSLNGKHSWWSTGFAYGVWSGVMRALDIEIQADAMPQQKYLSAFHFFARHHTTRTILRLEALRSVSSSAEVVSLSHDMMRLNEPFRGSTPAASFCRCVMTMGHTRVTPQTISARRWKLDMGLNGKGKDGSRELAVQLFPQSADMLKCDGCDVEM